MGKSRNLSAYPQGKWPPYLTGLKDVDLVDATVFHFSRPVFFLQSKPRSLFDPSPYFSFVVVGFVRHSS
jgi:hypothetical protein